MTELSYAIASGEQYAGLSLVERAAAEKDLHLSTCDEPSLEDCGVCQVTLTRIRAIVEAVRPVIEADVRRALYADEAVVERDWLLAEAPDKLRERFFKVRASVERTGRHAAHEEVERGNDRALR